VNSDRCLWCRRVELLNLKPGVGAVPVAACDPESEVVPCRVCRAGCHLYPRRADCPNCKFDRLFAEGYETIRRELSARGKNPLQHHDEYESCTDALELAIRTFDQTRSAFRTFLKLCIRQSLGRLHQSRSVPDAGQGFDLDSLPCSSTLPDSVDRPLWEVAMKRLEPETVTVLQMRFDSDSEQTFEQIGRRFRRSREWARSRYESGLVRLRNLVVSSVS